MSEQNPLDKIPLPAHLRSLYIYTKRLVAGEIRGEPPAPFDKVNVPTGLIGDFVDAVDQMIMDRKPWKKIPGSTDESTLWKLPNGKVFLEKSDQNGNLLSFTLIDEPLNP